MIANVLLVGLVVVALGVLGGWGITRLAAHTARLDGRPRQGTQTMATQMAAGYQPPAISLRPVVLCGAHGPAGMRCDIPPHTDRRHEYQGCGWYEGGGPYR